MTNFLNYVEDRLKMSIECILGQKTIPTLNGHYFDQYNAFHAINFDNISHSLESFINLYQTNLIEVTNMKNDIKLI